MIKETFLISSLLMTSIISFGQDFAKQFKDLLSKNDTSEQVKLLSNWAKAAPKDPELFIAYFNYYVIKSGKEVVSIDKSKKDNNSIELSDTETGKSIAYLNSSTKYNSATLQKGFDYIDQGILLYPARLDMRFGKIYMLGQAENYVEFTKEILTTIDYGAKINNSWLWRDGQPLENSKHFFLESLQEYITTIYNMEDDNLLPLMRQISEKVIEYYPDHVESLSNIALTYLIIGDYDKAFPYLLKAEKIAPKDVIVLNNIAETYKRKGDKKNAKDYYEKVIKYGNSEEILDAKRKIKSL